MDNQPGRGPNDRGRPSRIVLLARPGAGKSTQAERLSQHLGVAHLSTGALLRAEIASSSALSRAIAPTLEQGDLVPDELVMALIGPAIERALGHGGYVLDGFPRNLAQADALAVLRPGREPQLALLLDVSARECRRRLLARARDEHRSDDTLGTIERRLAAYEHGMNPVLDYYARIGLLTRVDGEGPADVVTARILKGPLQP
jgi:adenylate kinase